MSQKRVTVRRRIEAPAARLFALVSDPAGHVAIDGSGMLMGAPGAERTSAVGDTFVMDMDREPLGDFPMGKYQVQNTVTVYAVDEAFEWGVGAVGGDLYGHVYGYTFTSVEPGVTDVEHYCDWSKIPERKGSTITWPVVPVHMLERTLERLDELATR